MRGRKPTSTAERVLAGNPGRRPLNADEPRFASPAAAAFDTPPPPLARIAVAAAEWRRLAPLLRRAGAVTEADRTALMALCLEWARYLDATRRVARKGLLVQTPSGYRMPNPYLAIATRALTGCTKLWAELGLTPSSRSRVKTVAAPPDDPWSEFDEPPAPADRSRVQ